jgi:hypothetical protein
MVGAGGGESSSPHGRKEAESRGKEEPGHASSDYFLQLCSISQNVQNLPKWLHQFGTKASAHEPSRGQFISKPKHWPSLPLDTTPGACPPCPLTDKTLPYDSILGKVRKSAETCEENAPYCLWICEGMCCGSHLVIMRRHT